MATALALRCAAVLIFALGLIPVANYTGQGPETPWWQYAVRPWLLWSVPVLGLALAIGALGTHTDRAIDGANRLILRASPRGFAWGVGTLACSLAAFFAWYCFDGRLIAGDEMSLRFQARILLAGRLTALPEPFHEFFNTAETLDTNGKWFSQFPIGGAVPLAVGVALGVVWLVNPVFAGWATASMYRFGRGASTELFGRWTALLFALSPYVLFMAASQLNHASALAFTLWAIAALPAWTAASDARAARWPAAVIGLGFGLAATIRPYDAALCALAVGVYQLTVVRRSRVHAVSLAWQVGAGLIPVALLLWVNWRTTGQPLLFGYDALNGPEHRPGFHMDPRLREHTPMRGLYLASSYLMRINVSVLESPLPVLAFVTAALALVAPRAEDRRWDLLAAAIILLITAGYGAYWHEGYYMLGPRFMYTALPALVWLIARAVQRVASLALPPVVRRATLLVIPLCVACAWLLPSERRWHFGTWKVANFHRAQFVGARPDPVAEARAAGLDNALVFVRDSWHASLAAEVRSLGAPPLFTEMFVPVVDACVLQSLLDVLPADRTGLDVVPQLIQRLKLPGTLRPASGPEPDRRVALTEGRPLTPRCAAELEQDRVRGIPLPWILPFAEIGRDGRLGGRVIWARDLGPRDTVLRARFADRRWYRYVIDPTTASGRFEPMR
jgi:hypothetical protein